MCGKGSVVKIRENWNIYVPKLLLLDKASPEPLVVTEVDHQKALQILDRKLRSGGPTNKSPAAFSIHEVWLYKL